jgi:4,5-dihydroxyphthalate decarboxylase
MARLLTIACGDYDRTHALVDGSVRPEGLNLNWLDLPHLEIWTRMLNYYDFDASEISLSSFTIAKTMGKPLIGIPVFPGRAFRHSYIFVNSNSGIHETLIGYLYEQEMIKKKPAVEDLFAPNTLALH